MVGINSRKELSVIIPILNTKEQLSICLDSVLVATQNIKAEIILVDDGSTDGSFDIEKKYSECNENIILATSDNGPGAARNKGIEIAKGKYIAFVDSDDFVAPDIYENMLRVAKADKCDMVVCGVIRYNGKKYTHSELHRKVFSCIRNRRLDIRRDIDLIFDGTVFNRLISSKFLKKNNIHFEEGVFYEDVPFVQKIYLTAKYISLIRQWGYCWVIRKGSISQNQADRKNIEDRLNMLSSLKKIAKECGASPEYESKLDYKILSLEFNGLVSVLKKMSPEDAKAALEMVAEFINNNVDMRVTEELTVYDKQKLQLLLDRDVDGLIRLLNYKNINYMNAPVVEGADGYEMVLPDDIFTVQTRTMANEFNNRPYWMSIDSVENDEGSLTIHTHIYIRRISMPDFSHQEIKAFLINDMTGEELQLPVEKEMRPSLTRSRGTMLNYDDYREYKYNYDGTGFSIRLDIDKFAENKKFLGHNFIMMECTGPLGKKNMVLRFGRKDCVKTINDLTLKSENREVDFSMDEIEVFWAEVK